MASKKSNKLEESVLFSDSEAEMLPEKEFSHLAEIRMLREHIEQLEKTITELKATTAQAVEAPMPATSPHIQS